MVLSAHLAYNLNFTHSPARRRPDSEEKRGKHAKLTPTIARIALLNCTKKVVRSVILRLPLCSLSFILSRFLFQGLRWTLFGCSEHSEFLELNILISFLLLCLHRCLLCVMQKPRHIAFISAKCCCSSQLLCNLESGEVLSREERTELLNNK